MLEWGVQQEELGRASALAFAGDRLYRTPFCTAQYGDSLGNVHQLTFSFSYLHQPKFDLWAHNLFKGIDVGLSEDNEPTRTNEGLCRVIVSSTNGSKAKDEISIQVAGGM